MMARYMPQAVLDAVWLQATTADACMALLSPLHMCSMEPTSKENQDRQSCRTPLHCASDRPWFCT